MLGVWYKEYPGAAGAISKYHDAVETVTDKNGDFKIKGLGLQVIGNVLPVNVLIFKVGYEYESGYWTGLKKYKKKIKWEGEKAIIPLKKLTMEERKKRGTLSRPDIPVNKMELITKEINKERVEQGLKPFQIER